MADVGTQSEISLDWHEPDENKRDEAELWIEAPGGPEEIRAADWTDVREATGFAGDASQLGWQLREAALALRQSVVVDPDIRSGVPVLRGTRFPLSRVLAELADELNIREIADDYELDLEKIRQFLVALSAHLDRSSYG